LKRGEVTAENINRIINSLKEDVVLGVLSRVRTGRNRAHIPMMDFDERKCEGRWDIIESFFRGIGQEGVILHSGRAYHFYGVHLLQEKDWLNFLGKCILSDLVDDRYIGHRLLDGCGTLRISACPLRPKVPTVISTVTKEIPRNTALTVIKQ